MSTKIDRIQIEYDLTFTTLFHCGTGVREALVDRTVVRDNDGFLYVPGSTFKGTLRERCEQLARFYDTPTQLIPSPHDEEAALQGLGSNSRPSMITSIFGSHHVPGRLFFDDARLDEKDQDQYARPQPQEKQKDRSGQIKEKRKGRSDYKGLQVDLYTQVRLDRPTRTAASGALYTSEFGTRDITFKGVIQGWLTCTAIESIALQNTRYPDQTPTYSLLLLLTGLRMIERLGGNKSTGKGYCECKITKIEMNGHEMTEGVWKQSWFEHLDKLAQYSQLKEM